MKTDTHTVRTHPVSKSKRRITGQGMTEYIIIVALIALAGTVAVGLFGDSIQAAFGGLGQTLAGESNADALDQVLKAGDDAVQQGVDADTLKSYGN